MSHADKAVSRPAGAGGSDRRLLPRRPTAALDGQGWRPVHPRARSWPHTAGRPAPLRRATSQHGRATGYAARDTTPAPRLQTAGRVHVERVAGVVLARCPFPGGAPAGVCQSVAQPGQQPLGVGRLLGWVLAVLHQRGEPVHPALPRVRHANPPPPPPRPAPGWWGSIMPQHAHDAYRRRRGWEWPAEGFKGAARRWSTTTLGPARRLRGTRRG